jgi:hypothetical protein
MITEESTFSSGDEPMDQAEHDCRMDYIEFPGGRRFHFTDPSGNQMAVWSDR